MAAKRCAAMRDAEAAAVRRWLAYPALGAQTAEARQAAAGPPQPLLLLRMRCASWRVHGAVRMSARCDAMERGREGKGNGAA
jgi:hypothetical protein